MKRSIILNGWLCQSVVWRECEGDLGNDRVIILMFNREEVLEIRYFLFFRKSLSIEGIFLV